MAELLFQIDCYHPTKNICQGDAAGQKGRWLAIWLKGEVKMFSSQWYLKVRRNEINMFVQHKNTICLIFRARPEIRAVIHTHQVYATTVAVAGKEIPAIVDDQAQILGSSIKVTKYQRSNSDELAGEVVANLAGRNAVLIANHGAVCVGRNMDEAFVAAQILEKTCQVFIGAAMLGGAQPISSGEAFRLHQEYLTDYSRRAEE